MSSSAIDALLNRVEPQKNKGSAIDELLKTTKRPAAPGGKFLRVTMADLEPTSEPQKKYRTIQESKGASGFTKKLENELSRWMNTNKPADIGEATAGIIKAFPGLYKSQDAIGRHYTAWRAHNQPLPGAQRPEVRKRMLERQLTPEQQRAALTPQSAESTFMMSGVPGANEQREYKELVEQTSYQPTEMSSFDTLVNLLFMGAPVGKAGQVIASKTGKVGKVVQGLGEAAEKIPGAKGIGARAGYRAVTGAAEFTALQPLFLIPELAKSGPKAYVDQMLDGLTQVNINNPMILGAVLKTVPATFLDVLSMRKVGTPVKPKEVQAAKAVHKAVKEYRQPEAVQAVRKPVTPQEVAPVASTRAVVAKSTVGAGAFQPTVETKVVVKEPWEVAREEYAVNRVPKIAEKSSPEWQNEVNERVKVRDEHRQSVDKALSEGKPVPPEVLADYPELSRPVLHKGTEIGKTKSPIGKSTSNAIARDSIFFSDLLTTPSFRKKGLSGLDVPTQRLVVERMLAALQDPEIRKSIIQSVPVDVVDNILMAKSPTQILLHDKSVFHSQSAVNADNTVSLRSDSADMIVRSLARATTKRSSLHPSEINRLSVDQQSTLGASAVGSNHAPIIPGKGIQVNTDLAAKYKPATKPAAEAVKVEPGDMVTTVDPDWPVLEVAHVDEAGATTFNIPGDGKVTLERGDLPEVVKSVTKAEEIAASERAEIVSAAQEVNQPRIDAINEHIAALRKGAKETGTTIKKMVKSGKGRVERTIQADTNLQDISEISRSLNMTEEQFREWASPIVRSKGGDFTVDTGGVKRQSGELYDTITGYELRLINEELTGKKVSIQSATAKRGEKATPVFGEASFVDSIERAARERIAARRAQQTPDVGDKKGQRGAVYNPVDDMADYVIIGAAKIAKGTIKFKDWSVEMVKEFGEEIQPTLNKIWRSAQDYNRKEIRPLAKDIQLFGGESDPRFKFVQALKTARMAEPQKELMFAQTRSERYGKLASAMESKKLTASEARIKGLGSLKGEFERPDFEIPNFSKDDLNQLMEMARSSDALHSHYERLDVMNAVNDLVESGKQPEPRLYAKLASVYGPEFARRLQNPDISNWINLSRRMWVEAGGLQRALQTGFEASWSLIQGWRMALMEPRQWSKGAYASTKAFFSEKSTKIMDDQVRTHPDYELAYQAGLHLPEVGETTHPAYRDDPFVINSLRKIPAIKQVYGASERAFVTPGNVNRMGLFSKYAQLQRELNAGKAAPKWQQFANTLSAAATGKVPFKPGKEYITMNEARQWARYTNVMSSRGFLGKGERAADVLGAPFYSLRNLAAQIEHPFYIFHPNKAIQAVAIRHWVQYAGLTTAILTTAKLAGYEVETDSTSSDFGKIKLGNRRFDMLGGYGPLIRMIIRTKEGKFKSAGGKRVPTSGSKEVGQFVRFKVSPIIGTVWNSVERKDAIGQPYDIKHWANILDDWLPMFAMNIYDTWKLEGFDKAKWVVPYVFYGGRLQTYDAAAGKNKKPKKSSGVAPASFNIKL